VQKQQLVANLQFQVEKNRIMTVWCLLGILRVDKVSLISIIGATIQTCSLFVLLGCLLSAAPSLNSSSFVFFDYYNDTGFSSQGYVVVISFVATSYAFSQYDGSAHMAEESVNARVSAPHGIIGTVFTSGVTGLMAIFALLYSMQSLSDAISSK
jgi:amino acid transporter